MEKKGINGQIAVAVLLLVLLLAFWGLVYDLRQSAAWLRRWVYHAHAYPHPETIHGGKQYMKRTITGILAVLLVWNLSGCCGGGVTENAVVDLGPSEQFSQAELESAVECLETYFHSGSFHDCTMEEIWYDEEDSKLCAAAYLAGAYGEVEDGITAENVISLFGTFTTGDNPERYFSPYATYPYRWLMIRDNADSPWRMDMRGSGQG